MQAGLSLDHIGYAVANIERYLDTFLIPLLRPQAVSPVIEDPLQRVRIVFVTLVGGGRIELIETIDDASPVRKILGSGRGGLYHVCYVTEDLEQQIERFRDMGCLLISGPTPATAFDGQRIAFLYTPQRDIIELVESEAEK